MYNFQVLCFILAPMLRSGCLKWVCSTGALGLIILVLPYLRFTAFEIPPMQPFQGRQWYVPYSDLTDSLYKANFHAHSRSWGGLTWGENSTSELISAYTARGYDIPALSNYHKITGPEAYAPPLIHIPTYEHGFNLRKVHCLCIGARSVSFLEYPVHFSINHTRETISRLDNHCRLIALAHPGARNAHVPADMARLPALALMEVGNTMGVRTAYWDSTLSAGNPVWILSNDDTHDLAGDQIFIRWNMIYASDRNPENVLSSLEAGNHYGVYSYDRECEDNRLKSFRISDDTLYISLQDTFNRLDLIGQGGNVVADGFNSNTFRYALDAKDTYLRAEVHHDHCVMYLNPVIRYDGRSIPQPMQMEPAVVKSWSGRIAALILIVLILWIWRWLLLSLKKKKKA